MSKSSDPKSPKLTQAFTTLLQPFKAAPLAPTLLLERDQRRKAKPKAPGDRLATVSQFPVAGKIAAQLGEKAAAVKAKARPKAPRSPVKKAPRSPLAKGKKAMAPSTLSRRSAVALVLVFLLLVSGGYAAYRHLRMPKVHVKHVAKVWMDHSAGIKPQPVVRHHAVLVHRHKASPHHSSAVAHKAKKAHGKQLAQHKKKHKKHKKAVAHKAKKKPQQVANQSSTSVQQTAYSRP